MRGEGGRVEAPVPRLAVLGAVVLLRAFETTAQHAASRGTHRPRPSTEIVPPQRSYNRCVLGVLSSNTSPSLPLCPLCLWGEKTNAENAEGTRSTRRKTQKVNAKITKNAKRRGVRH